MASTWGLSWGSSWGVAWDQSRVTVPDVVGQSQASGIAELEGDGFVVAVETAFSSTVPAGDIISQSPSAGSEVPAGSTVTITVSLGEAPAEDDQPSGGVTFWFRYEQEQARRRKRRRELEEAEEETQKLADAVEREIAGHLHADLQEDERRNELNRLRALVAQFADREAQEAMSERVRKALAQAQSRETTAAYLALDRALRQQLEEEEFLVLMMLVNDD
jgi:hypothetical protein